MNSESKYWHLSHFKLSERLNKDEMMQLSSILVMEHFKKGDQIELRRGNQYDVYCLKTGILKIINLNDNGEEVVKYVINEGEIFGILGLTDGESRNDYAVAMEEAIICIIDAETLKKMMNDNAKLSNYIFKMAGMRIKKLERKLESLIHKDAQTRVKEFILDYIHDYGDKSEGYIVAKNLLCNRDIGKLTSTSRQTVNKVLNDLRLNEIIDFDDKIIRAPEKNLTYN